ncbi:MAG: biosynthetic-type acetolactate synthase large subunit, partial [Lachnospiraceae bacterium]|nr:biosynthetic-type acetolactate synthase large subunit [Lachnospiraceae bacterium]
GPGATNLVTGIATAYLDSVPLVVITGNVASNVIGQDNFQEVDIFGLTFGIVKHSYRVAKVEELADSIREAYALAGSGRPGPVLLDIPKDVQQKTCEFTPRPAVEMFSTISEYTEEAVAQAILMMEEAKRPCIYCGGGVVTAAAGDEIVELSRRLDAPICFSLMGLDAVPASYAKNLGMAGMHGRYAATKAISECDLLIVVGARFSDRAVGNKQTYAEKAKIIHIDIDPAEIDKNVSVDLALVGDAKEVLGQILKQVTEKSHSDWQLMVESMRIYERFNETKYQGTLTPFEIIDRVSQKMPKDTPIVTDVGQHQMWVAQRYAFEKSRTFLSSGGLGTMGFGMGAANGACIGTGKKTVLFTGDGSFGMNMSELGTAVTEGLPVIVILMNNGVLGMVRQLQQFFSHAHYSQTTTRRKTDFVAFAKAMGADGYRVETPETFEKALETAMAADGPVLIECVIDKEELVYPMVPPNKSVNEIMLQGGRE